MGRPRQESPKRKLFPFHFEIRKRKRGPDFTVQEEHEIVDHFKTHGGFGKRGGNTVWSKRGGSGGQRGKRRKEERTQEEGTQEKETRLSVKEKLKRKAESQEGQDSPP